MPEDGNQCVCTQMSCQCQLVIETESESSQWPSEKVFSLNMLLPIHHLSIVIILDECDP